MFLNRFARHKEPCVELAQELSLGANDPEDGALSESQDRRGAWYLMVLVDPLLSGLPLVSGVRVCVNIVRVDIEWDQTQGLEAEMADNIMYHYISECSPGWVDNWHVIGGVDGDSGDIGASTGPYVWHSLGQYLPTTQPQSSARLL